MNNVPTDEVDLINWNQKFKSVSKILWNRFHNSIEKEVNRPFLKYDNDCIIDADVTFNAHFFPFNINLSKCKQNILYRKYYVVSFKEKFYNLTNNIIRQ